jgi:arsenate reductase
METVTEKTGTAITHRVLFVCVHNSARSQMAETFLKQLGGDIYLPESAGLEPGSLNPNAVEVLQEIGIDISKNGTQDVWELFKRGERYNAVITVCDGASAETCPLFPGLVKRIGWSFADPSGFTGTKEEILEQTRVVRDQIKEAVLGLIEEGKDHNFWMKTR